MEHNTDKKATGPVDPEISGHQQPVDQQALKRALLKLDVCLLPVATLIYFLNFLDR